MKATLITYAIFSLLIVIEAIPQRNRRPNPTDERREEVRTSNSTVARKNVLDRRRGGERLKGIFVKCQDKVKDFTCPDGQRARSYPNSACADLKVGLTFPQGFTREKNPCIDEKEGKEVSLNSCYVCTTGGRNAKIADPITSLDLSVASKCKKFGRRGLKPDRSEAICTA